MAHTNISVLVLLHAYKFMGANRENLCKYLHTLTNQVVWLGNGTGMSQGAQKSHTFERWHIPPPDIGDDTDTGLIQNWMHEPVLLKHSRFYFLLPKEWSESFVLSEL